MTKYEFLGDLSRLLADLPEEERTKALHYYEDYFADAGEEKEQEVLKEFGSPEKIARQIREDSSDTIAYGKGMAAETKDPLQPYSAPSEHAYETGNTGQNQTNYSDSGPSQNHQRVSRNNTALIILVLIVTSPVWGTAAVGILGAVLGIVSAFLGVFAALILGGGGAAIGGIGCIIGGFIACLTGELGAGLLTIGIGCLLFSVGGALCYLGIFLCTKLFPWLWQWLQNGVNWCSSKLNRKEQSI